MRLKRLKIKLNKNELTKKLIFPEKLDLDLAEETGIHIGDGSMNYYKNKGKFNGLYQLRRHRLDDRDHYDTRIKEVYKSLYNLDLNLRDMRDSEVYGFQLWSDSIVEFKNKVIGLPLGNKLNIKIPKIFLKKTIY